MPVKTRRGYLISRALGFLGKDTHSTALVAILGCVSDNSVIVPNTEDTEAGRARGEHLVPADIIQKL